MTLISAFTIGVPSFVLALEPNHDRIKGNFLINVIVRSIPSAFVIVLAIIALNILGYTVYGLDYGQTSTLCVLTMSIIGFMLVIKLSIPFTPIRIALIVFIVAGTVFGCVFFGNLFNIADYTQDMLILHSSICLAGCIAFFIVYYLVDKAYNKYQSQFV